MRFHDIYYEERQHTSHQQQAIPHRGLEKLIRGTHKQKAMELPAKCNGRRQRSSQTSMLNMLTREISGTTAAFCQIYGRDWQSARHRARKTPGGSRKTSSLYYVKTQGIVHRMTYDPLLGSWTAGQSTSSSSCCCLSARGGSCGSPSREQARSSP